MHQNLASRLRKVNANIQNACAESNADFNSVKLIAVSKLQSIETILAASRLGVRDFGESYAQELAKKALKCPKDIIWHFIGPIQTNKIRLIAKYAQWIHSLDRLKVAEKLNAACKEYKKTVSVLVQVNIDNELSKSGIKPEDMISFAQDIGSNFPNLNLKGLMFMPNINLNKTDQLKTFKNIQSLMRSLVNLLPNCDQLSLGTSSDYIEAIKTGSSMIRIGEDLLGPRS
jgi:pyridoxal phosphate enzyme (YggS family)